MLRSSIFEPSFSRCRISWQTFIPQREFSLSAPLCFKKVKARPVLSKAVLAAKERRRALKIRKPLYELEKMTLMDAISILRAVEIDKPYTTYELVIKTIMNRGSTIPKGRFNLPREPKPKSKDRVLVFAEGKAAEEAKKAGAEFVGGTELIEGITNNRYPATLYLCTPSLISAITPKLGRVLGPKGLMPSERRGTVTDDIGGYLRSLHGSSEWKGDKNGTIRLPIAKIDYPVTDVVTNVRYFVDTVKATINNTSTEQTPGREKDRSVKPSINISRVILSTTQGPGIQIKDI